MSDDTFMALIAEGSDEKYEVALKEVRLDSLPAGDVLVEVLYSSLNYKDGLALTGKGKIIRKFPMICGVDLAGRVIESSSPEFSRGDQVLAVGQELGETRWGGFSQRARLSVDALLHLPSKLTLKQSMAIGTAGFTAMLSLMALEHNGAKPSSGPVVVTGAAGGVGSLAVALFAAQGYNVSASTGRVQLTAFLNSLGAQSIIDRSELQQKSRALAQARWANAVDTVGGQTLASVIASLKPYGSVAACGLAGGSELPTTVFPFILRNVSLLGINTVYTPKPVRIRAWDRLAAELPLDKLEMLSAVEPLSRARQLADQILAGAIHGRVVLDVNA